MEHTKEIAMKNDITFRNIVLAIAALLLTACGAAPGGYGSYAQFNFGPTPQSHMYGAAIPIAIPVAPQPVVVDPGALAPGAVGIVIAGPIDDDPLKGCRPGHNVGIPNPNEADQEVEAPFLEPCLPFDGLGHRIMDPRNPIEFKWVTVPGLGAVQRWVVPPHQIGIFYFAARKTGSGHATVTMRLYDRTGIEGSAPELAASQQGHDVRFPSDTVGQLGWIHIRVTTPNFFN